MSLISEIAWGGWPHCAELNNGKLKLIATTDVGPRIIYCGAADSGHNLFYIKDDQQGLTGSQEYRHYGGHRLWHSPQIGYRPNQPDNTAVSFSINNNSLLLECPAEEATKVQKEIEITIDPCRPKAVIRHRIYNRGLWPIKLAPWALTMMAAGGTKILPVPKDDTLFMPSYAISFWPWTRPNDHRFILGQNYITLKHDSADEHWFKIGYRNTGGWGAYIVSGFMFIKRSLPVPGEYPDYGSTFETFADNNFIELETLGPLTSLEPGAFVDHSEEWFVFDKISLPLTESQIEDLMMSVFDKLT
ncbi:MAG: hypothetical protein FWD78_10050 [Treponema sp.]|nr:hypothetical protein [Treponema sp.]